ncbi:hypothetical protein L2E82_02750 [Cichorium intybus]|uniref:Uncharacterized protein n=1 Tax=Cichorium intybus TaxID=13427 RepID=A0ACB9H3D0_CICIN|nr:hypothetical protein L2E82_02750 [Cichorium intybus]
MSIALDSPMEALAIHGVLTAVNNVWAWIAFLTAAISFWKIKSSIHPAVHLSLQSSPPPPSLPQPQPQTFPVAIQPDQQNPPSTTTRTDSLPSTSKRHTAFCTLENRKSGKFSVYYAEDDKTKDDVIDSEEDVHMSSIWRNREEGERVIDSIKHNGEPEMRTTSSIRRNHGEDGWEMVLKMKTAEMGWYLYQDLTVLDGNVVRLWN